MGCCKKRIKEVIAVEDEFVNTYRQSSGIMKREKALDAFRGMAILLMVLSSSIAFGILPGWMYHAQVPPPLHVFNPAKAGITWVDLVFPFFLFSMGAAIPLSMCKRIQLNESKWRLVGHAGLRFLFLAFFAFFTLYARPSSMAQAPSLSTYLLSIACFAVLFLIYGNWTPLTGPRVALLFKVLGLGLAACFLSMYPFHPAGFRLENSDVIIVVLANMALWSTVLWLVTRNRPLIRIGVLPFVMAILLASQVDGSINATIFSWTPAPWLYKFYYLKYLFIVVPGTLAGDWLVKKDERQGDQSSVTTKSGLILILVSLIVLSNIVFLYNRFLMANFILTTGLSAILVLYTERTQHAGAFIKRMLYIGLYLLLLGLFFEAYEGGIKKDVSTFSYYFVTGGLAFLVLAALFLAERHEFMERLLSPLALVGRNPMIAYTAGNLLLIPVLKSTGLNELLDAIGTNPAGGLLRGVIFTTIVALFTIWCSRKKLIWKT